MNIYLRPLKEEDALTSYKWRNNPKVWEFTRNKPGKIITPEIELKWIREVINNRNDARYAICIRESGEYIGNVQLTNIGNGKAEFHLFIGEEKYWGKKIGTMATLEIIQIGFNEYNLNEIFLFVNKKNLSAIKVYQNSGFQIRNSHGPEIKMVIQNDR